MSHGFEINRHGELVCLTAPPLAESGAAAHFFTTRHGGVSAAPFDALNLDFKVGDDPGSVAANRKRACALIGAGFDRLVAGNQVHGNRVVTVDDSHAGRGARSETDALPDVDAMVTAVPGLVLSSYYADCVPLFCLDPVRRVAALAHAGWKGSVLRIGERTVRHMADKHGCRPGDVLVAIGPSVGPCCYEVDGPVMSRVEKCLPGVSGLAAYVKPGHWRLDLPGLNRRVLLEAGVREENITMSGYCTACRGDLFFSHRAQKGRTGRMASFIMLTGG
ncbi:MAG: peptidoglycan editing factor PgeF [Firmicutes bacterium]|nr:peptidoglycan editing factor PgeF [Bacillota bacterium]